MKVFDISLSFVALGLKLRSALAQSTPLLISVDGVDMSLSEAQVEYDRKQNHSGAKQVVVSDDGKTAEMEGNMWRAFPLPDGGIDVTENTILEFDFVLEEEADLHMICLDQDKDKDNNKRCFVLAKKRFKSNWKYYYTPQLATMEENTVHFKIPVGRFWNGNAKYLAFVIKNGDKSKGRSTISNIELSNKEEPSSLSMTWMVKKYQ